MQESTSELTLTFDKRRQFGSVPFICYVLSSVLPFLCVDATTSIRGADKRHLLSSKGPDA